MTDEEKAARRMQGLLRELIHEILQQSEEVSVPVFASLGIEQVNKLASNEVLDLCRKSDLSYADYMAATRLTLQSLHRIITEYGMHLSSQRDKKKKEQRHLVN